MGMELTKYSRNRLMESLSHWGVDKDFADPMYNYLVHGFEPGGFFTAWYANEATAILHSHPANSVEALKNLTKWMVNCMPRDAWGSRSIVKAWLKMSDADRRQTLELHGLVYSEQTEIMMALKNEKTVEPHFW
jgi:hypothetical protein